MLELSDGTMIPFHSIHFTRMFGKNILVFMYDFDKATFDVKDEQDKRVFREWMLQPTTSKLLTETSWMNNT